MQVEAEKRTRAASDQLISRRVEQVASARLGEEPVIALQGPRAVGKTTLLRALAAVHDAEVLDLDDQRFRDAVATDLAAFVAAPSPVFIDEYQHLPAVLDAIKAELNRDGSPGRYVITGSTRHDALPRAAQALTGRFHLMAVHPFSQGEIAGVREDFLETLFGDPAATTAGPPSTTQRAGYVARVVVGGFPMALSRPNDQSRGRWFGDYIRLCLERDAAELARIQQRAVLPELLARLAAQTGQILNVTKAGQLVGLKKRTADNYVKLLEDLFLVHRLPAWGRTLRARTAASPKIHVVDSGLAAHLLGLTAAKLSQPNATSLQQFGHLLETFVVGEVRKQASWMDGIGAVGHWRTREGVEVDLVIERHDGAVIAFEVKAGSRVANKDIASLCKLRDALGDSLIAGVVMHTGPHAYVADERIYALPVDRLWRPIGALQDR